MALINFKFLKETNIYVSGATVLGVAVLLFVFLMPRSVEAQQTTIPNVIVALNYPLPSGPDVLVRYGFVSDARFYIPSSWPIGGSDLYINTPNGTLENFQGYLKVSSFGGNQLTDSFYVQLFSGVTPNSGILYDCYSDNTKTAGDYVSTLNIPELIDMVFTGSQCDFDTTLDYGFKVFTSGETSSYDWFGSETNAGIVPTMLLQGTGGSDYESGSYVPPDLETINNYNTRFIDAQFSSPVISPIFPAGETYEWKQTLFGSATTSRIVVSYDAVSIQELVNTNNPRNALGQIDKGDTNWYDNVIGLQNQTSGTLLVTANTLAPNKGFFLVNGGGNNSIDAVRGTMSQANNATVPNAGSAFPNANGPQNGFIYFETDADSNINCYSFAFTTIDNWFDCEHDLTPSFPVGTGEVTIDTDFFLDVAEIDTNSPTLNPTTVLFSYSLIPETTISSRGETINNTVNGTSSVVTTLTSLVDGVYDLRIKFSNFGCSSALDGCPFPDAYIYTNFTMANGSLESVAPLENYNALLLPTGLEDASFETCGLLNIGGCINNSFKYLFYPSTASVAGFSDGYDDLTGKIPFVYATQAKNLMVGMYSGTAGVVPAVTVTTGLGEITFISESMITTSPFASLLPVLRGLIAGGLWVMLMIMLYRKTLSIHNREQVV
jgi:hypothetical protein